MTTSKAHAASRPDALATEQSAAPALLILAALCLAGFVGLTVALLNRVVFPFDAPLLALGRSLDGVPAVWNTISQSANFPLIGIGVGFVLWLLWRHRYHEAVLVAAMLVLVTAGSEGVKQLTARPRPAGNGDGIPGVVYSFPSGHVLEALTILGAVAIRFWRTGHRRRLRVLLAVAVVVEVALVGVARLALNEHYPTDLLGGVLGGVTALSLYAWFTRPSGWADPLRPPSSGPRSGQVKDALRAEMQPDDGGPLPSVGAVTTAPAAVPPARELGLATMTVVVGFASLVAILVVLGSVAEGVRDQEVFALDTWATPFLHGIASPGLDTVMNLATDLGSILVIPVLFVVSAGLLTWSRRYRSALLLLLASAGSLVLQGTMKLFFARPRPQLPWASVLPDYSFPSGHTMNAVVFYGALALILWSIYGRRLGLLASLAAAMIALSVGVSRIYLGYHYLTDVVGGILAGLAWLVVVGAAFQARPTWRRWRASRRTARSGPQGPSAAAGG